MYIYKNNSEDATIDDQVELIKPPFFPSSEQCDRSFLGFVVIICVLGPIFINSLLT